MSDVPEILSSLANDRFKDFDSCRRLPFNGGLLIAGTDKDTPHFIQRAGVLEVQHRYEVRRAVVLEEPNISFDYVSTRLVGGYEYSTDYGPGIKDKAALYEQYASGGTSKGALAHKSVLLLPHRNVSSDAFFKRLGEVLDASAEYWGSLATHGGPEGQKRMRASVATLTDTLRQVYHDPKADIGPVPRWLKKEATPITQLNPYYAIGI